MGWWTCLIILPVCTVIYLLYIKGFVVTKSIRAVMFGFWPGKNADKAVLDSCTGWARHAGSFHEGGIYEFTLACQLSKGDVKVFLLGKEKQQVLKLDRQSPAGRAELEGKSRYYLRWELESATGKCELRWQKSDL